MPAAKSPSFGEFIALMAMMTSLVALSIDAVLPALGQITTALHIEPKERVYLLVSLFFLGTASGQLVFGPVADAYGRRPTIFIGLFIFALGSLICIFAQNLEVMLLGRVIQAFGVAGPRVATMAVIRDKYSGERMAKVMSFIMMVFILVPMLAPLLGQGIMLITDWIHIFTFFLLYALVVGLWFFARQTETLNPANRNPIRWNSLFAAVSFFIQQRLVVGYTLASGFIFGSFLAFLSASQAILQDWYATNELFPLYFAVLAFGVGLASFVNGRLVMRFGMTKLSNFGLAGLLISSLAMLICCWAIEGLPTLNLFMLIMFGCFFFTGMLFGNFSALAMQPLGHMAGLGAAMYNAFSGFISVGIAVFAGGYIQSQLDPLAIAFCICSLLAILSVYYARRVKPQDS